VGIPKVCCGVRQKPGAGTQSLIRRVGNEGVYIGSQTEVLGNTRTKMKMDDDGGRRFGSRMLTLIAMVRDNEDDWKCAETDNGPFDVCDWKEVEL
jgi:hypothetical protein